MDVEYVALETTDEFLTQGLVQDVGKNTYWRQIGIMMGIFLFLTEKPVRE